VSDSLSFASDIYAEKAMYSFDQLEGHGDSVILLPLHKGLGADVASKTFHFVRACHSCGPGFVAQAQ